jgi:hypothetical protein
MRNARWLRLLAYVTGSVNQELLARNEYLAAENQILRAKLPWRLRLFNSERTTLAELGKRLGPKALREVATVAKRDTILAWYRRLIKKKFDGSELRQYPGRPPVSAEVEALVVRMARERMSVQADPVRGRYVISGSRPVWPTLPSRKKPSGEDNKLLFPAGSPKGRSIECHQQLGGLLEYYRRAA